MGLHWDSGANREKNVLHCRVLTAYTFIWVISTQTVPYNAPLVWYIATLCLKVQLNILNHMQSVNHSFILVISTLTVPYNVPLVWYIATLCFKKQLNILNHMQSPNDILFW